MPVDERTDIRSNSTSGDGADGLCRIAVKLPADTRGGSAYMWRLGPGARLTMSVAARNRFKLSQDRPDYLLVADGIGITPLYGMALALADAAFADELRERVGNRLEVVAGHPVNHGHEGEGLGDAAGLSR